MSNPLFVQHGHKSFEQRLNKLKQITIVKATTVTVSAFTGYLDISRHGELPGHDKQICRNCPEMFTEIVRTYLGSQAEGRQVTIYIQAQRYCTLIVHIYPSKKIRDDDPPIFQCTQNFGGDPAPLDLPL